jgi:hypothetical protein
MKFHNSAKLGTKRGVTRKKTEDKRLREAARSKDPQRRAN